MSIHAQWRVIVYGRRMQPEPGWRRIGSGKFMQPSIAF
jgi:hypothetical protein